MQTESSPLITHSSSSPSFNSYSSSNLTDIAARVVQECANNTTTTHESYLSDPTRDSSSFNSIFSNWDSHKQHEEGEDHNGNGIQEGEEDNEEEEDYDDDFEFAVVSRDQLNDLSADEIFYNGQIKPCYPLFNTDLLLMNYEKAEPTKLPTKPTRLSLRKLFSEESGSCSSSEADDLDGVPTETYCVWRPKGGDDQPPADKTCKKSNSTGTSKRWRFRDLLPRSNSDGSNKDHHAVVFLTPNGKKSAAVRSVSGHGGGGKKGGHDGKRQSILPKQDFVGFISSVNGLSKNLHPF